LKPGYWKLFAGQEQVIQNVLEFSSNLLERTKGGLMAVLGIVFLMYVLIKLMGNMESTFNQIWRVEGNRLFVRKITDYITIALVAGLLVIFSGSATIFITGYLEKFMVILDLPASLGGLISLGLNIFPFVTVWMVFTFFYMFIPNKNVNIRLLWPEASLPAPFFSWSRSPMCNSRSVSPPIMPFTAVLPPYPCFCSG
jgi:membrane protein